MISLLILSYLNCVVLKNDVDQSWFALHQMCRPAGVTHGEDADPPSPGVEGGVAQAEREVQQKELF